MEYTQKHMQLREVFNSLHEKKEFEDFELIERKYQSKACYILPGQQNYHCIRHNCDIKEEYDFFNEVGTIKDNVHIKDISVNENREFNYNIIKPKFPLRAGKVTFMFHGFNEKSWDKYLTWAQTICEKTESAVVMFPIAFHMQRAPLHWSDKKKMFELSEQRKKKYPNINQSTLSNVAISMRLHSMPQRFIWSGLQTYYDIIDFIESCKRGEHEFIDPSFTFNMFAYSIGGFLSQILKLSNYKDYFKDTKVCLFCSGAVFNRLSPVSKFILDSEANVALYSFLIEHFDKFLSKDSVLKHYITQDHIEGEVFHAMLDYHRKREFRETLLRKWQSDIYAVSLRKDYVIPSLEIINTLKGAYRDIGIEVEEFDFDYGYTHENPFPLNIKNPAPVDKQFRIVFDKICDFLK